VAILFCDFSDYREVGPGIVWRSTPVHPALPLSLSAREVRVMTSCAEKLRALGLRFSKTDLHSVRITGVPTCLLLREDREVRCGVLESRALKSREAQMKPMAAMLSP